MNIQSNSQRESRLAANWYGSDFKESCPLVNLDLQRVFFCPLPSQPPAHNITRNGRNQTRFLGASQAVPSLGKAPGFFQTNPAPDTPLAPLPANPAGAPDHPGNDNRSL